ncbi:hypothetical protein F3J44_14370 [Pantoea sp. Tr-811]|uniref:dermonecrotic toxin domain-containing protein n=1 Tax=Pantoea sp. Tr-811 TaxID=2608361 RepID=UPI0014213A9E|nr:hypothetical protein [Pantoea sp. Tr-811]
MDVGIESGIGALPGPTHFEYDPSGTPRKVTLLEAALHNFTHTAEAGPYSQLHQGKTDSTPMVGLSVPEFIDTCRELDLGQQYQGHLAACYDGADKHRLETLWCQASKDALQVQAHIAALRGRLGAPGLAAIGQLCTQQQAPQYDGAPLGCWRLDLFGTPLHEVLVIGPNHGSQTNPCILYIPGAPDAPLQEYASASAAAAALALRMQHEPLLQCMLRFAPQALQAGLAKRVREHLFDRPQPPSVPPELPKPNPRLLFKATPLPVLPWPRLYAAHVARLKADAATLAVPTADVDAKARVELFEHIASLGLDLANVAALFIPGLNTVMLAVGAAQLMESVFHGIEAWEQEDKAQAAAQLESVLLNIALMGAVAGGAALLKQSRFVDSLLRIEHAGGERLWHPDVHGYASPLTLPETLQANTSGQLLHEGRHYVRLDGQLYEQTQGADGQWRLEHPRDPEAYRPVMRPIAGGAWRIEGEQPLDWPREQLLQRLGADAEALEQADLDAALRCTGLDEDALRHAHVSETGTPPLLADALKRLRIDQETSELINNVRHGRSVAAYKHYALPALVELPGWPQDHVIELFQGPEPWGASTLYGQHQQPGAVVIALTRTELEQGKLSQAVLQQLDDANAHALVPEGVAPAARASALDAKLANTLSDRRAALFDSLMSSSQPPLGDAARVIKRQFTSLPNPALDALLAHASPAEHLRLAAGRVPLRLAEEARRLQAQVRLDRALLGLYRPSLANADSHVLSTALQARHPNASAAQRLQTALTDRTQSASLLGQQPIRPGYRSPLRLADGRHGYPLSGRGRWREWVRLGTTRHEERRLQELYPSLDAPQRRALLDALRQRGDIGEQIRHLQRERAELQGHLQAWADEAQGDAREHRLRFQQAVNRAARRDEGAVLTLQHMTLEHLPALPARLDHITSLNVQGLNLQTLSPVFLQSFPHLERLRLSRNPALQPGSLFQALRHAPQLRALEVAGSSLGALDDAGREALASLRRLRELRLSDAELTLAAPDLQAIAALPLEHLHLSNNAITLTADSAAQFGQMTRLVALNLSHNPLGIPPALARLHHLQTLELDTCALQAWPEGLTELMNRPDYALRNIQLSENAIHRLPTLEDILASAYAQNLLSAHGQNWEFHFNRLEPEQTRQLRAIGVGVVEHADFLPEATAVDWRAAASTERQQVWDELFDAGNNRELREVVERVGRSAQALHNQPSLGTQVWRLLEAASEDLRLRERLNEVAGEFPPSCGDAGADGFSTLEIELLAFRESRQANIPGPYLFQFYQRLFRREQVNLLAARIHAARLARQRALLDWLEQTPESRPQFPELPALDELDDISLMDLEQGGVDDIEIRLALRQSLAEPLAFPEPSQDMLYRDAARISSLTIDHVEDTVRARDEAPRLRRAWIAGQPSWRRFLRVRFATRFSDLDARWYQGMTYLDFCLDPQGEAVSSLDSRVREALAEVLPAPLLDDSGNLQRMPLNSQQYEQALKRLMSERQAELEALYARLTRQQDPND